MNTALFGSFRRVAPGLCLIGFGLAATGAISPVRAASIIDIQYIGQTVLPTSVTGISGTIGDLSDIGYDTQKDTWYVLSDSARMFRMDVDLSDGFLDIDDATIIDEAPLDLSGSNDDPEGLDIGSDGTWWVGTEGNANANDASGGGYEPFVANMNPGTGNVSQKLPLPTEFDPIAPNGIRHSRGFEGVALSTEETRVFTAAEEGLSQDKLSNGSSALTRLLEYDLLTGQASAEYAYLLDSLLFQERNGIAAMLSLGGDDLLVLERGATLFGFVNQLYHVNLANGSPDNVIGIQSIASDYENSLIQAVQKDLVRNLSSSDGLGTSNIEGLAFGAWDGLSRPLLLVSDDGDPITDNTLFAYNLTFDEAFGVPLPASLTLLLLGLVGVGIGEKLSGSRRQF